MRGGCKKSWFGRRTPHNHLRTDPVDNALKSVETFSEFSGIDGLSVESLKVGASCDVDRQASDWGSVDQKVLRRDRP